MLAKTEGVASLSFSSSPHLPPTLPPFFLSIIVKIKWDDNAWCRLASSLPNPCPLLLGTRLDYIFQVFLSLGLAIHLQSEQWNLSVSDVCHFLTWPWKKTSMLFPLPPLGVDYSMPLEPQYIRSLVWLTTWRRVSHQSKHPFWTLSEKEINFYSGWTIMLSWTYLLWQLMTA